MTSEWPTKHYPRAAPYMLQQIQFLRDAGVDIDIYPFHGSKNPLIYVKGWIDFHNITRETEYDLVHVHWGQNALIVFPTKLPVVITFHGSDLQGVISSRGKQTLEGKLLINISRFVAKFATQVIIVSDHLDINLPDGITPHIIPSGVNLSLFHPIPQIKARQHLDLPNDKKIILFAAAPERRVKRFSLAKSAINLINQDRDIVILTMGDIPHHDVPLYMNAADVLLLTSRHEGSPTVIKEALACQLPIVSTDVGDVRGRISHISGCFLCENDEPETIAFYLQKALSSGKRIAKLENLDQLDEATMAKKIIQVYQLACANCA